MNLLFFVFAIILIAANCTFNLLGKTAAEKLGALTYVGLIFLGLGIIDLVIIWPVIYFTKSLVINREGITNTIIVILSLPFLYLSFSFLIIRGTSTQIAALISIGTFMAVFVFSVLFKGERVNWGKIIGLILGGISIYLLKRGK